MAAMEQVTGAGSQHREEQLDAIVRAVAYHRKDYDLAVIWFPPHKDQSIRPIISEPFLRDTMTDIGSLGLLPLELLQDIFLRLDIRAVFNLRQTNNILRKAVGALKEYQQVVRHGLNLLCALLRTRHARKVSLSDFYQALCTKGCAECGNYAGFISLPTWQRCCFPCLQTAPRFQMHRSIHVQGQCALNYVQMDQLTFTTLRGRYTMKQSLFNYTVDVASMHQAQTMMTTPRPETPPMQRQRRHGWSRKYNFMSACALPYLNPRTGMADRGVSCAGCQFALEQGVQTAVHSTDGRWPFEDRDRVYSRESFLDHFKTCQAAQHLWGLSDEGKVVPAELPQIVRRGGYFQERNDEARSCECPPS